MTKTKFFSILSKLVAKGFCVKGAAAEVNTYISGNTDLCITIENTDKSKFKRVTFHRELKAAHDLCAKMNKWIVRFNMQQVEEVVEVETIEALEEVATVEAVSEVKPVTRRPVEVLVHWSESAEFPGDEVIYPFAEFERKAKNAASLAGSGMGYDKTKITVTFTDGGTYQCRLDLAADATQTFQTHTQNMTRYAATDEGESYYRQVGLMDCVEFLKTIDFTPPVPTLTDTVISQLEETSADMKLNLFCDFLKTDKETAKTFLQRSDGFLMGAVKLYRDEVTE